MKCRQDDREAEAKRTKTRQELNENSKNQQKLVVVDTLNANKGTLKMTILSTRSKKVRVLH